MPSIAPAPSATMFFSAPQSSTPTTSTFVYGRNMRVPTSSWKCRAVAGSTEATTVGAGRPAAISRLMFGPDSAGVAAWAEAGGLVAIPNLRGGGEYGERWHRAGMLANKQNVFEDFHRAAETLVANGWTEARRLAISGGSNGGLLVGAALTQRPELF